MFKILENRHFYLYTYGYKMENYRNHQHSVHSFLPGNSAYRNSGQSLLHSPLHALSYNCRLSKYDKISTFGKDLSSIAVHNGIMMSFAIVNVSLFKELTLHSVSYFLSTLDHRINLYGIP